jgi:hypothetical protein
LGFPDSDDGNSHGLPNRPDILRTIGANPRRPTFHDGLRKTRDGFRIPEWAAIKCLAGDDQLSAKLSV